MKIVKTAYERFGAIPICLGRADEKGVVGIEIDISSPLEEYPDAYFGIAAEAPDGTEYPVVCETEGKILKWIVNDSDTAKSGKGRAQVVMYGADGEIGRSKPVDTSVLPSIIAKGNPPDPVQNWLDNVQNASGGGAFAPVIEVTAAGDEIFDAVGGRASSVVATLDPKLENGSLAPNPNGGCFAPWSNTKLTVNGEELTANVSGEPYIGSFDWVTGKTETQNVQVLTAEGFTIVGNPATNSAGLKYIRVSAPEGFPDLTKLIACNRYTIKNTSPYVDDCIRANSNQPYIYDNDIDFENPTATLDGLEFMLPADGGETHFDVGRKIVLAAGENTVTADSGDVTVTYGIDTKTYIDNKFAELSAALLGG